MEQAKAESMRVRNLYADALTLGGASVAKAASVANIAASTNITAVPGSFADLAAVQAYLAGAAVVPNIEARLDAIEAKVNALLAALRAAGLVAS